MLKIDKSIFEYTFTVVDIETTGFSPYKGAEIIEISAVKIKEGLRLDLNTHFTTLVKPNKPISPEITEINKIDNDMIKDAPFIDEVLPQFANFVENTIFLAHNAKFDFSFLNYYMKKFCIDCKLLYVLDTVKISKRYLPHLKRYNLDNLIKHFDINIEIKGSERHRAFYDAVNTSIVFLKIVEKMKISKLPLNLESLI
jgi:DNA polymerase III epsilon subunit family exonuclease